MYWTYDTKEVVYDSADGGYLDRKKTGTSFPPSLFTEWVSVCSSFIVPVLVLGQVDRGFVYKGDMV